MAKNLPSLFLQERGWVANSSTTALQWQHECGCAKGRPSLRPTATRMESSILKPRFVIGRAWSHAPDSGVDTERSLALVISSVALCTTWRRCPKDDLTTSESQDLWILTSSLEGGEGWSQGTSYTSGLGQCQPLGKKCRNHLSRSETWALEAVAEDIKPEGASCTALRRPKPPE